MEGGDLALRDNYFGANTTTLIGGPQTAAPDLRLVPPSRNRRHLTVEARGRITDSEDIVANEVGDRNSCRGSRPLQFTARFAHR